jgi:ArsR family metal-binding transcriptional regulator
VREIHYSVSYNAQKRLFSVYRNERKIRVFPTEKVAWEYVMDKQEAARAGTRNHA